MSNRGPKADAHYTSVIYSINHLENLPIPPSQPSTRSSTASPVIVPCTRPSSILAIPREGTRCSSSRSTGESLGTFWVLSTRQTLLYGTLTSLQRLGGPPNPRAASFFDHLGGSARVWIVG